MVSRSIQGFFTLFLSGFSHPLPKLPSGWVDSMYMLKVPRSRVTDMDKFPVLRLSRKVSGVVPYRAWLMETKEGADQGPQEIARPGHEHQDTSFN